MFSNISITRECRKNLINLKGRRYNEVTDLSEDELARYLKIDNDLDRKLYNIIDYSSNKKLNN